MTQMTQDNSSKLEFTFESDAVSSFLVIMCNARVLEYQALMLEHNQIRHVIPVDVVRKEGATCFYYNITSMISLSLFLNRRKLTREEFLNLLLNFTAAVDDSVGYLLTDSNFIFDPEYIYISPETLKPAIIYVPVSREETAEMSLQGFIADLMLQHINIDGFGSGNSVQRILAAVKSEMFNIKGFKTLLTELLYGQAAVDSDTVAECGKVEKQSELLLTMDKKENEKAKNIRDNVISKKIARGNRPFVTVFAVLVQIVMGSAIYLCRSFLNKVSDNPTATYAAVAMIVLAVEVFIFKKLSEAKMINMENETASHIVDGQKDTESSKVIKKRKTIVGPNDEYMQKAKKDSVNIAEHADIDFANNLEEAASELAANAENPINRASCKTELLGRYSKGVRLLKSTCKQNGEDDILIDKDDFIIGRLEGHVDHILKNNAVGKLHVQMIYRNSVCFIKDLNSVNGTFINNKRIESNKEFELKENDKLQIANSEFVFIGG